MHITPKIQIQELITILEEGSRANNEMSACIEGLIELTNYATIAYQQMINIISSTQRRIMQFEPNSDIRVPAENNVEIGFGLPVMNYDDGFSVRTTISAFSFEQQFQRSTPYGLKRDNAKAEVWFKLQTPTFLLQTYKQTFQTFSCYNFSWRIRQHMGWKAR